MSKLFWCIIIVAVLLLASCDSSSDVSSDLSQESFVGVSDTSSVLDQNVSSQGFDSHAEGDSSGETPDPTSSIDSSVDEETVSSEQSSATPSEGDESEESDESEETIQPQESEDSQENMHPQESSVFEESSQQPEQSTEVSVEVSDDSSEKPDESSDSPNTTPISSIDRSKTVINIAKGKSYTNSAKASSQYPDSDCLLTDGISVSTFNSTNWVGFNPPPTATIVLDLGKTEQDIADLAIGILRYSDYGIGSPASVTYEISTDGKNYQKVGTVYRPKDVSSVSAYSYDLKLAEPVSARYVRYTASGTDSAWLFIGELFVRKYIDADSNQSYYGDQKLPQVSVPVYWPENSSDYNKTINLIAGKTPIVQSKETILQNFATEYYNSIIALPKLTDGKYAVKATYSDPALVHFTRGSERYLYFDLGYTSAVSGFLYSFINENGSGVYAPSRISVYLSDNAVDWQRVYTDLPIATKDNQFVKKSTTFDKVYKARFVMISFAVSSHAFCDELQIMGTKAIPSSAVTLVPEEDVIKDAPGYLMPEDFLGVHNVFLSYHCLPDNGKHSENGLITVDEYLPHVGYYDQSGKLVDTFFDAFLYLPYTSFNFSDYGCSLDGWKFYLDDIYMPNRNMDALNQAVEQVKSELNKPDYKCTVFTSIMFPWKQLYVSKTPNTFGDVDGDGVLDSFSSLANRKKAVKWMIDQEYTRFMAGNYDHLTFGGFYWFEEAISVGSSEDKELINYAVDYAHSLGVKVFWIPYYCASGYDRWQDYGFDAVCMQPNYMFGNREDPSVLKSTAEIAQQLGMCVEIEMNSLGREEVLRYMEYLTAGEKYGYMHAVKMYYQSGVPGVVHAAYLSKDPFERSVYDLTYLFAKEKFTSTVPEFTTSKLEHTVKNTDRLVGSCIATGTGLYQFALSVSPSHGDLCLNEDGSFIYYPNKDYTGVDRFSVILDYGYGKSDEIVVTITVK